MEEEHVGTETTDAGGSGDAAPPIGSDEHLADAGEAAGETFAIDGRQLSADEIRRALDSHVNRESWERAYKQRDQRMARVRNVLEGAFGKSLDQLSDSDYADLSAFASFNTSLRGDPTFRDAFKETIEQIYRQRGATPREAERLAEAQTQRAEQGGAVPPEVVRQMQQITEQVQVLHQREQERAFAGLANHLETQIASALDAVASDLPEYRESLRRAVLYGLTGHGDDELLRMAQSGELAGLLREVAERETKATRAYIERALKGQADAVKQARRGSVVVPMGAAGSKVTEIQPRQGAGLRAMHERFRKDLGEA